MFCTEVIRVNPVTGEHELFHGPNVPGISKKDAEDYLNRNGMGYLTVTVVSTGFIPTKGETLTADWPNKVDLFKPTYN